MKMTGSGAVAAALLVGTVLFFPVSGKALPPERIIGGVQEKYEKMKDMSAAFVQESRVATLGRSRRREGKIFFSKPGRMRWEYAPPDEQLLLSDGETFWFHSPARKQVVVQKLDQAFTLQTPLLFLFGDGDLRADFMWDDIDVPLQEGAVYHLQLRPVQETPDLVSLTIEIRERDFTVAATVLRDAFGNVTRLDFSGERENEGLADSLFHFTIPAGTEVVKP